LAALNNPHFDFAACNFTSQNMQTKDKNGESKEGSGRQGSVNSRLPHHLPHFKPQFLEFNGILSRGVHDYHDPLTDDVYARHVIHRT
jgi:hypothetical protein